MSYKPGGRGARKAKQKIDRQERKIRRFRRRLRMTESEALAAGEAVSKFLREKPSSRETS